MVNRIVALTVLGMVVAAVAVLVIGARPFYPGHTAVTGLTAQYDVRPDGGLDVTETITYEYGASGLPLDRVVQLRRPATGPIDTQVADRGTDRVWEISHITATDADGASVPVRSEELNPNLPPLTATGFDGWDSRLSDLRIQIGRDLPYAEGVKREAKFVLRYRVHGALEEVPGGYELNWPDPVRLSGGSFSTGLLVPVDEVRVSAPADLGTTACLAYGPVGSRAAPVPCSSATVTGRTAAFAHEGATMTVRVRIPGDSISGGGAEYDGSPWPRWARMLGYAGVAVGLLVVVGLIARWRTRPRS
jgi:hypothetical protein